MGVALLLLPRDRQIAAMAVHFHDWHE